MVGINIFSYRSNISLTLALNSSSVNIHKSLIVLKLLSLIPLCVLILTSIFTLIKSLWSSLPITISQPMGAMLMDCDWNISTFVNALQFDVDMAPMPKVDDGIQATSSTLSHIIGGLPSLDNMGVVGTLSMTFCLFFNTFPMACPFFVFNYAKTFSFCSTSFSLPFSLEVLVFNSF